jgi:hypothetical protein
MPQSSPGLFIEYLSPQGFRYGRGHTAEQSGSRRKGRFRQE